MGGYEVDAISSETLLLAEVLETRQHFFLFLPDFLFLPAVNSPCRTMWDGSEGASFSGTHRRMSILFSRFSSPRI
jgi:hypothetical protein